MARDRVRPQRRYTDGERANALAALAANRGNVLKTARQLGVPERTLAAWARGDRHPEAADAARDRRGPMADAFEAVAWRLIELLPAKMAAAPLNHTATALGIAVDKMRLLRGEPTSITENTHDIDLTRLTHDQLAALDRMYDAAAADPPAGPGGAVPPIAGDVRPPGVAGLVPG